ncbi:hypothetical protein Bca101_100663 [Brassica carinata]
MESTGKSPVSDDPQPNRKNLSSSAVSEKPNGKSILLRDFEKPNGKSAATSEMAIKPNDKTTGFSAIPRSRSSSAHRDDVMFFRDVTMGPHEEELRFRLIHFWEARNPNSKALIGVEMLLIDEQRAMRYMNRNAIQGFIPKRIGSAYVPHLKAGSVYRLNKFYGSKNKVQYSVADHSVTISFGWNSVLSVLTDSPVPFHEDRFRFRSHEEFEANCDLKGGLYDYLGHMKLVNGQPLTDCPMLDEVEIAKKQHLMVHVQIHGGPLVKLYIWDKAAADFAEVQVIWEDSKCYFSHHIEPKTDWRLAYPALRTFALTTMSSSRVFMDTDVQPTRDYLSWLASNSDIALKIDAEIVTKPEAVTIAELFTYIKKENANVAWFECTATIDHVVSGAAWYYISCGVCHTKATKGPKSLMCKKCGKAEIAGVPEYLTKISVYDKSDQAFCHPGDAGFQLTGHHASELVANHFESNENIGDDQIMPVPQALTDTSGQTHKFLVKVSKHNLQGLTQSITVSKVLPPEAPEDNANTPNSAEILDPVGEETGASMNIGDSSTEGIKRSTDNVQPEAVKRARSG